MKIIDLEAHFFTETYVEYLRKNKEFPRLETVGAEGGKGERLLLDGGLWAMRDAAKRALLDFEDARFAEMDANHVALQVLSLAGPGCELFKPSEATPLVREINDEIAGVMKKHPDRFVGLAALAPQDPEGAADELERAV